MRLGHINLVALKIILDANKITINEDNIKHFLDNKCHTCLMSRGGRKIHRESINPREYGILDRIHSDIGGPLIPTHDRYKYYITFLDKKSRFLWVVLLRTKDEAYKAFEVFKTLTEKQSGGHVKEFFTDNGGEYVNKRFRITLEKYGISHQTTPAYTKEPNGLIEHMNLILFNKIRSFLIHSQAPTYLWGEALHAAVYVYNRTPHSSLQFKTPYEVFYNTKPIVSHIRIWGSITFYHDNIKKDKLAPRRNKALLVGFN